MAQPASPFQPRELVRSVPFSSPSGSIALVQPAGQLSATFDVGLALSDREQLGYTTPQGLLATGILLDASLFADQAGTLDVLFKMSARGLGLGAFRSIMPGGVPQAVPASTLTLVAGLRCIGSVVKVLYVNTAVVAANVEFWAAARSS